MCRNMTSHMTQQVQEYVLTTDPPAPPPKTMLREALYTLSTRQHT